MVSPITKVRYTITFYDIKCSVDSNKHIFDEITVKISKLPYYLEQRDNDTRGI
jgi:hypothetical protein